MTRSAHQGNKPGQPSFAARVLRWHAKDGRHDLPWQQPRSAYRVWLSEVMLQQTQVATVIPYFARFVVRFPDVRSLAAAHEDEVLALWSGLGYYARARNLHRAAQRIVAAHDGRFPEDFATVAALPGIGRSTAGAILSQAFGQRHAILDGNVRRLLCRWAGIDGWPGTPAVQNRLWTLAESLLPTRGLADYAQAVMDMGATVCTARKPRCTACPLRQDCIALRDDRIAELPTARPRRPRPLRHAHLLLAENPSGSILLERRPPSGVWGGLWCPPLVEDGRSWQDVLAARGLQGHMQETLPVIRHGFTHFELHLAPLRVQTQGNAVGEGPQAWFTLHDARALGLPAPVRKLLQRLE